MTFIPGTGTLSEPKSTIKVEAKKEAPEVFSVVNVQEIKHPKVEEEPDMDVWYLKLKYWVALGSGFSVIFAILSILDLRLLFLLPLGPYVGYLSWHIRKMIKKYVKKVDAFS